MGELSKLPNIGKVMDVKADLKAFYQSHKL